MRGIHWRANASLQTPVADINGELEEARKRRHCERPRAANGNDLAWFDRVAAETAV